MFKDSDAFSGFSVDDIDAARKFYGDTLGLDVKPNAMDFLDITLRNGARILIYPKPDHQPATYTMLNFVVPDIEQAVDELNAKGVQMEHYDMPGMDARGIGRGRGPAIAWFKDPAGNVLAVIERQ